MIGELLLAAGIALIVYSFYNLVKSRVRYFEERNVKCAGAFSNYKTLFDLFTGRIDFYEAIQRGYYKFPNETICGAFDFSRRQYILRDAEACKKIGIKEFESFDHRNFVSETMDEVWINSLVSLKGEKWRQMRSTLSPAFTGSKMRQMFELISECADDVVKYFAKKSENNEKLNIEMKDLFTRYANDVIATCAFGIKVNSIAEPQNEFYLNGKKLMDFGGITGLKFFIALFVPKIAKMLKMKVFDETLSKSFKNMILNTMKIRHENKINRPDMINILMQVREGTFNKEPQEMSKDTITDGFATVEESELGKSTVSRKWNDNEIVAQCLLFFFAGFETTSTTLTFASHALVSNPDIQQKLYEEIAEMNEQLGGKRITYDALQKLKYLDQVICETLRKNPGAPQIDRNCTKDYIYDDGKLRFKIEKFSNIAIPIYSIHNDPKYWPNPDKFDPERFSDENKHNITPGSYLPFGIGPRNCIGSRFALIELKAILYYLLLNFSFEVNKDTQIPLKMKKGPFMLTEKGVHLELKPRK